MVTPRIDLNCDLGERFGVFQVGQDEHILPFITSANLACGYHAGDPLTIHHTMKRAIKYDVNIGAHPSLPDLMGFGRRKMSIPPNEIYHYIIYQLGSLQAFAQICQTELHHVKPHGALYNMSAEDPTIAEAIAQAVYDFNPNLILFGLAQSNSTVIAKQKGLRVAEEVFADRTYQPDRTLTPRTSPNAVITDVDQSIQQVIQIILEQQVVTTTGDYIPLQADTVCIHGDHPQALTLVKKLHVALIEHGIDITRMG